MQGRSLLLSFRDAFRGIAYIVGTQRNARIQWGIGLAALVMGVFLRLPARDWAILVLTVAAGAVLLLAIGAVAVGIFILGPPLWLLLFKA
jgi:diacylglycerol kinase